MILEPTERAQSATTRRRLRRSHRPRALAVAAAVLLATLAGVIVQAPGASADPTVHTIVEGTAEAWAPYTSATSGHLHNNVTITIACYLTGDSVTGPYGAETVWDLVSGGSGAQTGTFVPDADLYTGSNSPVVPRCSLAYGKTIGSNQVPIYSGPGTNYSYVGPINPGQQVEIRCYSTGTSVNGPYGSENIWDLITPTYFASATWVPDALVYTGSNSSVVPHC